MGWTMPIPQHVPCYGGLGLPISSSSFLRAMLINSRRCIQQCRKNPHAIVLLHNIEGEVKQFFLFFLIFFANCERVL